MNTQTAMYISDADPRCALCATVQVIAIRIDPELWDALDVVSAYHGRSRGVTV